MDTNRIVKSTQEQAVAAWIEYLNQVRLEELIKTLQEQDINLDNAMEILDEALKKIHNDVLATNRGGDDGAHGFIAEIAQWGIENAKHRILGEADSIEWVNNDGPTDLIRTVIKDGKILEENIQQKFYHSGDGLSLNAIMKHLEKYPDYLKNNGKYEIPKDQYEKILWYASIPEEQANKMQTSDGSFSLRQWRDVQKFKNGPIGLKHIEPAETTYSEVQKGKIDQTIAQKRDEIKETDKEIRKAAYDESRPSFAEGAKTTAVATLIECTAAFTLELTKKIKLRKGIGNLSKEDWEDIGKQSGYGAVKGAVRGSVTYTLTNTTNMPAYMASAMVTCGFGIAEKIYEYNKGEIDEVTMIEDSEILCLDTIVSTICSLVGQYYIPVPVVGAMIGNAVGMFVYGTAKDAYFNKQNEILDGYINSINQMAQNLSAEYNSMFEELSFELKTYMDLCSQTFSVDVNDAFEGSIKLAKRLGVPDEEILDSKAKAQQYFNT